MSRCDYSVTDVWASILKANGVLAFVVLTLVGTYETNNDEMHNLSVTHWKQALLTSKQP